MMRFLLFFFFLYGTSLNGQTGQESTFTNAEHYYRSFNQQQSLQMIEKEMIENPESVKLLLKSARLKRFYGLDQEAASDIRKAEAKNPYIAQLYGFYGPSGILEVIEFNPVNSILELDTDKRLSYYLEVLNDSLPSLTTSSKENELLLKSINQIKDNKLQEGLLLLKQVQNDFVGCAMAYDLEGMIWEELKEYGKATKAITIALNLEPGYDLAWYNLSRVERMQGNLENAKNYLDIAIELKSDLTKAYFDRALLLKLLGEEEKALEDYNRILEIKEGDYAEVYFNRGLTQKMLGNYRRSIRDLDKAIE